MPYKNKEDELAYLQRSRGRRNANARLRYLKNPEKILANNRKWRQENLDKDKKIKKEYYLLHKQAAIDRAKAWKKRNPNKVKAGDAVYRLKNEDKIKALFITHGHEDHIGGITFLLSTVKIPVIYAPNQACGLIKRK